jgi:hypothetical protein
VQQCRGFGQGGIKEKHTVLAFNTKDLFETFFIALFAKKFAEVHDLSCLLSRVLLAGVQWVREFALAGEVKGNIALVFQECLGHFASNIGKCNTAKAVVKEEAKGDVVGVEVYVDHTYSIGLEGSRNLGVACDLCAILC